MSEIKKFDIGQARVIPDGRYEERTAEFRPGDTGKMISTALEMRGIASFWAFIIVGLVAWIWIGSFVGGALTGLGVAALIVGSAAWSAHKKNVEKENRHNKYRIESPAQHITYKCQTLYRKAEELQGYMEHNVWAASSNLQWAKSEFSCNAFAPYWDAVEKAMEILAIYDKQAQEADEVAREYFAKLNGVNHTFPDLPFSESNGARAAQLGIEFRNVARLGQTNYHFASIWEHRRTRQVLIAGFRTLGDAVNNLGFKVEKSANQLRASLASDVARAVKTQISEAVGLNGPGSIKNKRSA